LIHIFLHIADIVGENDAEDENNTDPEPEYTTIKKTHNYDPTKTKDEVKRCTICGLNIRNAEIHRRTNAHLAAAKQYNWRGFDDIADKLQNNFLTESPELSESEIDEFFHLTF
jgi:hypothetical protein